MTAIAFIKEESLGSEPLCGGVEAAAVRATTILPKGSRGVAIALVANVSPRDSTKHCRRPHARPYHGRFALTAGGRRRKGSYVPSESEDIDLK